MDGSMGDNGPYGYTSYQHHHTFHHSTPNLIQYPMPMVIGGYIGDQKTRRFTPDQHVFLEGEFRADNKPTTAIKRGYATQLGVSLERINNWFQNRRAKKKQEDKKAREDGDPTRSSGDDDETPDTITETTTTQDEESEIRPSTSPILEHASPFENAPIRPSSSHISISPEMHPPQRLFSMPIVSASMPATPSAITGPPLSFSMSFPSTESMALPYDLNTAHSMMAHGTGLSYSHSADDFLSFTNPQPDLQPAASRSFMESLSASPSEGPVVFNTGIFASSATTTPELMPGETASEGYSEPLDPSQNDTTSSAGFPMGWGQSSRNASTAILGNELTPTLVLSESTEMPPPESRRNSPAGLPEALDRTSLETGSPDSLPLQSPGLGLKKIGSLATRRNKQGPNHLAMGNIRQGLRTASYTAGLPLRSPRSPASPFPAGFRPPARTGHGSFRIEKTSRQSSMASPSVMQHIESTFAQQEQQLQPSVSTPHTQFVFHGQHLTPQTPMTSAGTNPYLLDPSSSTFPLVSPTPPFTPADAGLGNFLYTNGECPTPNPVILQHQQLLLTPQSAPPHQGGFPQSAPPTQTSFII